MDSNKIKSISKLMSLALRHKPEVLGIILDKNGWVDTQILLEALHKKGLKLDFSDLEIVVNENDKKRFAFNLDKTQIRANQGHSVNIDLGLEAKTPPETLFHGTDKKNLESIKEKGLLKGTRQHVHLSNDIETALKVAKRHGKNPIILKIRSLEMQQSNFVFFLSENNVWLTDYVPTKFIQFEDLL